MTEDIFQHPLVKNMQQILQEVVLGQIMKDNQILSSKIRKPRYVQLVDLYFCYIHLAFQDESQALLECLTGQLTQPNQEQSSNVLADAKVRQMAALIVTAYPNPSKLHWHDIWLERHLPILMTT